MTTINRHPVLVAIVTAAIETAGFIAWLVGIAADQALLGLLALDAVLIVEHVVQAQLLTGRVRFGAIVVFSQIETFAVWAVGLALGNLVGSLPVSAVYWSIGLTVEHTLTDNVLLGRKLFAGIFDLRLVGPSIIEAIGGALAVAAFPLSKPLAALAWFVPNAIEHAILDVEAARELP